MSTEEQKLTIKQRKFIRLYLQTGNASRSALQAGYKDRQSATENLSKPYIQNLLLQFMEQRGITDKKLSSVLKEGLNAKRIVAVVTQDDKDKRIEVPDISTRHRYLETALKLKGNAFERADQPAPVINNTVSVVNNTLKVLRNDELDGLVARIISRRQGAACGSVCGESPTTSS